MIQAPPHPTRYSGAAGQGAETEIIPSWGWGNTELGGSKSKKWKGFLKPNFELGPNPSIHVVLDVIFNGCPEHIGRIFIQL